MKRIVAITSQDNVASIRLLEKLGFRFERMARASEAEPEVKLFALAPVEAARADAPGSAPPGATA